MADPFTSPGACLACDLWREPHHWHEGGIDRRPAPVDLAGAYEWGDDADETPFATSGENWL